MFGRDEKPSPIRLTAVQYIILAIFLFLAYGLWRLQVSQSDYYSAAAERNRVREVPILAPRGKILDRYGRTIVDNYPSFTALLMRDSSRDLNADADLIASGLHMDPREVREKIRRFAGMPQYQPIYLKEDITPDEEAFIEAHKSELPELDTIMAYRRLYPRKGFLAHLIGYVGEVSEDMLNEPQFEFYNPGDVVGKSGVELEYNQLLMGTNGSRQVVVNSHGKEVGQPLDEKPAVPGKPLKLTVDIDLQIAAEEAMEGKNGAVVAMDPRNGEILAMVSRPIFDPNDFAIKVSSSEWSKLVNDDDHPLLNKAIQAQLAPGSTFKIIMATAGLQEGIAQNMHVFCNGGAEFYGRYFRCWISDHHKIHGDVDISKGIYQSCDVFFYTLAEKLGIEKIAKYATMLGLGQKTGIDLPQEASGVVPSEEWKIRNFKQKWFAGETISVGIGQGALEVTPIQLARAIGGIASGGILHRPHVLSPSNDLPAGFTPVSNNGPDTVDIHLDPKNWEVITDAMANVTGPLGTAGAAHLQGIDFAGKTGTAQTISAAGKSKVANGKARFKNNAWFVGVSPRRNPQIVVAVLWESGEEGPLAAIVASQVIKAYVQEQQRREPTNVADAKKKIEVGAVWTDGEDNGAGEQKFGGGHFWIDGRGRPDPLATAAPGLGGIN
ncbi:MAG TPA: penicillin-binding protein 2 [Terriglobales bacterium]|nr:penicillin-binding protein 2 [Terriglobales bacterium]HUK48029.1 penicillin-binding protein 2 [Terriglobales bacterium]